MDKEVQDKIVDLIDIGKVNDHLPSYTARTVIELLEKLNYRRLPKGKSPLLYSKEIQDGLYKALKAISKNRNLYGRLSGVERNIIEQVLAKAELV